MLEASGPIAYKNQPCWKSLTGQEYGGYPTIKSRPIYQIVYELAHGAMPPKGEHIHHCCHNKKCCNPAHLRAVWGSHHSRLHNDTFLEELRQKRLAELREAIESEERVCA
jgi:hypothetical protein